MKALISFAIACNLKSSHCRNVIGQSNKCEKVFGGKFGVNCSHIAFVSFFVFLTLPNNDLIFYKQAKDCFILTIYK